MNWNYMMLFLSIPVIGIFDYFLFRKWLTCEKCGYENNRWYSFIIPTFIEITLFLAGIGIGVTLR